MRQLKRLLHYVKPYWFYVAASVVSMALVGLLDAFRLLLIGPIFDFVLNPGEQSRELHLLPTSRFTLQLNWFVPGHFHNVWTMVAFALVAATVLKGAFDYLGTYLVNYAGFGMITDLRNQLYTATLRRSVPFFQKHTTGTLLSALLVWLDARSRGGRVTRDQLSQLLQCQHSGPSHALRSLSLTSVRISDGDLLPAHDNNIEHARAAAAVRRRERLVQVQMHHVNAKVTGPCHTRERVHVRAVHVQQRVLAVKYFGNFRNLLLKDAERRRIGDHQRGHVFADLLTKFADVDLALGIGLDIFHLVAGNHRGRWICAVRRVGNQHLFSRVPVFFMVGADEKQSGKFALRTSCGLQGNRVHGGDFEQALFKQRKNFQATLRQFLRLGRVFGREAGQPRNMLVHPRVVFHGAGAEWVHSQINGVIPRGKTREVTDYFDFADFRKTFHAAATVGAAQGFRRINGRNIERRKIKRPFPWRRFLENQPGILIGVPRCFFDFAVHLECPLAVRSFLTEVAPRRA